MPRSNRNNMANGLHHVTQRGLQRAKIVLNDDDRRHWWRLFDRVALRYQWRVFAVVLLDNHFHIYLRTPVPNLSEGMRDLNGGYSSAFNQRHEREGPLFQGRFKSILIENDSHSWEVSRYVHLNPYRAGIVEHPLQYRWSTYRFYLDGSHAPAWLDSRFWRNSQPQSRRLGSPTSDLLKPECRIHQQTRCSLHRKPVCWEAPNLSSSARHGFRRTPQLVLHWMTSSGVSVTLSERTAMP